MHSNYRRDTEKTPGFCLEGTILNHQVWLSGVDSRMMAAESNQAFLDLKAHCGECNQCLTAYNAIHKD
jgi:hypothetical protein